MASYMAKEKGHIPQDAAPRHLREGLEETIQPIPVVNGTRVILFAKWEDDRLTSISSSAVLTGFTQQDSPLCTPIPGAFD